MNDHEKNAYKSLNYAVSNQLMNELEYIYIYTLYASVQIPNNSSLWFMIMQNEPNHIQFRAMGAVHFNSSQFHW